MNSSKHKTEAPRYRYRAICTSNECRLKFKSETNRTEVGIVKSVGKAIDWCPECGDALFWERIRNESN
jgi:hypothetical protein